jgi:hypothetical protein
MLTFSDLEIGDCFTVQEIIIKGRKIFLCARKKSATTASSPNIDGEYHEGVVQIEPNTVVERISEDHFMRYVVICDDD